jgi:hypothetical protein
MWPFLDAVAPALITGAILAGVLYAFGLQGLWLFVGAVFVFQCLWRWKNGYWMGDR